jgi:LysR family transcriptional regulator, glycine cleavage system transcriptional activator
MMTRRRPRLSLDLLRGFRSAARHLSFTRAARELNVTQPAISREIKTLEEQLGQPLFRRVSRALQLTQAGEELFHTADEALELLDAATERLAGAGRTPLAVTTTPALASTWLAPRLVQFARRHPDVDVRVLASNDMVDIAREHVDVAIRYVPPWADVPNGELLVDYAIFPVCAPAYLRESGRPLATPGDLAHHVRLDYETVLYGKTWYDWGHWFDALALRPVRPAGTLRFSHYDMAIEAALEGGGVAIGKWPHLASHLRAGALRAPLGRDWIARLGGFHVVVARDAEERDAVTAFVAWLRAETRRDRERAPASLGLVPRAKAGVGRARRGR